MEREAGVGVIQPQAGGAWGHQKLAKAGKGSPAASEGVCPHLDFVFELLEL